MRLANIRCHLRSLVQEGGAWGNWLAVGACGAALMALPAFAQSQDSSSAGAAPAPEPVKPAAQSIASTSGDIAPCSAQSAKALDKTYNLKGWVINPPSFADSLSQDAGCWRTELAKHGISFMAYDISELETNLQDHYVPPPSEQAYLGQRPFAFEHFDIFLLYDLSQYGIPDGQIQIGGFQELSTYAGAAPDVQRFSQLAYYQTAFHKTLEFNIGIMGLDKQFIGSQIGGNISNVLGPSGSLYSEMGGSSDGVATPAAVIRWNISNTFYNKAAISQSIASTVKGAPVSFVLAEAESNPQALHFGNTPVIQGVRWPTSHPLYIEEFGYKKNAGENSPYTWIRATGMYNVTKYENLANTKLETTNGGLFFNADRQILQTEPGSPSSAYKGVYAGATAAFSKADANSISQDYQLKVYTFGLLHRPQDSIVFSWDHQVVSHYVYDPVDNSATCTSGVTCIHHSTNTYLTYYTASIIPGVRAIMGLAYVDNPSVVYSPNAVVYGDTAAPVLPQYDVKHAVNYLAALFINF